ncbi:hypothetical protein N7474_009821 [Penicillium riverlandense]|uniref:uncharacterized protein n=1 Tax=Penicillium riverlandense TaxID=1903569 RepID=UPI002546929D|nr:uncharacterized protein N7474_009821 [Penicillium riverlandense]KAJ5808552.1 hypothetical protein N7474_009821 [Penicillium riverlandense]
MPSRELQFIITAPEAGASSSSQQRVARAHAARTAHAKARRLRTSQYQAQKKREELIDASRRFNRLTEIVTVLPASRKDPFTSFARPLQPLEQRLFDHYVTGVIPLMRCTELAVDFSQRMTTVWVPLALTEANLLDILFLASCRNLSASYHHQDQEQQKQFFTQLGFQYKLKSLQSLRDAISAETPVYSDSTVAKAIMLAYDELFINDEAMLKRHVDGAVRMVGLKGGPQTLGLDGLLEHLLSNLLSKVVGKVGIQVRTPWEDQVSSN